MINSVNYDSDETYCTEGELFIKNQENIRKQDEDRKLIDLETEEQILKYRPRPIKIKIEHIKKALNSWFETNAGLPKYILDAYISDLKKFHYIADSKISKEDNYQRQIKWLEISQVSEKLQELINSIINKKNEINNTSQIEESQSLGSEEIIIESISEKNSQKITNNDENYIIEDWTNGKESEPPSKKMKLNKEISQNTNLNLSNDSIENILPDPPKLTNKKRNMKNRQNKNKSISLNKAFINDNIIKFIQNESSFSQIDNNEKNIFSETNKENSLSGIRSNCENKKNLEDTENKPTKMITLSQLSRPSQEQTSQISQNNPISDKVIYEFWQHDENEFLKHETLPSNTWGKGWKIPEEFYKDLDW